MESSNKNRIVYIDIVRIFALLCVIGVHWVGTVQKVSPVGETYQIINHSLDTMNALGVPIFFALSGFLTLRKTIGDIRLFYKRRLIRLGIPYLVYAVIYVGYLTGIENKSPERIPISFIHDVLTANVHGTHWFVFALLGLTFAAPFISIVLSNLTHTQICILYAGAVILTLIGDIYGVFGMSFPLEGTFVFCGNLLLYIGGYCMDRIAADCSKSKWGRIKKYIPYVLIGLFLIQVVYNTTVVTVILSSLIFFDVKEIKTSERGVALLKSVSKSSYSMYLIHAAVVSLVWRFYCKWTGAYFFQLLTGYIIVFVLSLIIAILMDWLIVDRLFRAVNTR